MFMRAYALLRELVRDCGGILVEERPKDRKARQLCALFEGRTHTRFRMCWDRKDGHGILQVQGPGESEWLQLGPKVRKGRMPPYSNLHEFMVTAERLSGTRSN
jgi:hypothetical protein